ncbi:MAG: OB-fold domain-containing protein [Myxococcota bacterium]
MNLDSETARRSQAFEGGIREYVGMKEGPPFACPDLVNEPMIRHWCEVMGDANPAYLDADVARKTVHGGIVAPPTMLQTWDMRGYPMRDPALIQNKQRELHALFDRAGYTGVVATDTEQEFIRYLRPGDQITSETTIESISEEKATGLGIGYFIVTRTLFTDQNGDEVGWLTFRVLKFKPSQPPATVAADGGAPKAPARIRSPRGHDNAWWWEGIDAGLLLIQKCSDCSALRHPPRPMCGACQSSRWETTESSGEGTVYSYTVLHHPPIPGYDFPCPVVLIDLQEGTRLVANIAACKPEEIHIGMKVECRIEDAGEGMKLPFFYPVS